MPSGCSEPQSEARLNETAFLCLKREPSSGDNCTSPVNVTTMSVGRDRHGSKLSWTPLPAPTTPVAEPELEWIPLSQRQALAREKIEEEERAKKMASKVAPCEVDTVTGALIIPESCLPIKHWNRWMLQSKARADAVQRRCSQARMTANKVMRAVALHYDDVLYENYSTELARLQQSEASALATGPCLLVGTLSSSLPHEREPVDTTVVVRINPETEKVELGDHHTCARHTISRPDTDVQTPAPMMRKINPVELFSKLQGIDCT